MGDVIKKKLVIYMVVSISSLLLITIYSIVMVIQWQNSSGFDEKKIRIDANSLVYKVEAADSTKASSFEGISMLPFTLVNLDGTVIYTQNMKYYMRQKLDLHTLSSINSSNHEYKVPVSKDGKQFGILLLQLDDNTYRKPMSHFLLLITPLLFFLLILAACFYFFTKAVREDIFHPIEELHKITRKITEGNLHSPLTYDYDGSIGTLCHDFELMRSELYHSSLREQAFKEKETLLLASISHDLKTPLASITGYVEGILCDIVEEKEDIKNYAEIILNKATSLNRLIDDILEHSKAQLNQFSIQKEELYAAPFFENMLLELSLDAKQRDLEFIYESAPNVLLSLDPDRISQVMRNIVDNSIKYCKKGGKIQTSFLLEEHAMIIYIEDNGLGIAAADLPFIFNPFYRGDKARTQGIAGSGLGLNISKYIVENHGGSIECDSILGVGTTVTFSLPL